MMCREINNVRLSLLLLLLSPLTGNSIAILQQKSGTVAGSMMFIDPREETAIGNAAKVTVELEYKKQAVFIVSDEVGDFIKKLASGTYCLKSARTADNKPLNFSPSQSRCFNIKPNKDSRFDVMFLKW
jgi:hypothetical protein